MFKTCTRSAWFVLAALMVPASARGDDGSIDFERDVAPILEQNCIRCHQPDNKDGAAELTTFDALESAGYVTPGKPEESYLLEMVTAAETGQRPAMPKEGQPLEPRQVELLRQWIAGGATWPDGRVLRERSRADRSWWSLHPLANTKPPNVDDLPRRWQCNPIDRFVQAKLTEKGVEPSPRADKRTLIRRAFYDLTGLPPSPEDVRSFLDDDSPDAWERLNDRLLASPHYGERWGRHWLDVVRFGESRGFERNEIIDNAWPFRDYVIASFNEDKPFDRLVREHLAGDVIGAGDPAVEVGTTFLVCGPFDDVGNQDPKQAAQIRANTIDEMIRTASESFLGLTVGCARCHDHKFDPISQRDYYAMYATFAGVHHASRAIMTSEERQRRESRLKPLHESRDKIQGQIAAMEDAIVNRSRKRETEIENRWTRPPVKRTGTEETFAPVRASYVRVVVEGTEANPAARTGFGVDEFEVWTAEETPRNVALAAHGGHAEGRSRVPDDFADAYSAKLTIDGNFGARWIAAGPELTVHLANVESINRIVFSSDRNGDAGNHPVAAFVSEYRVEVSLDGEQFTTVADSHDRRPVNDAHRRLRLVEAEKSLEERRTLARLKEQLAEVNRQIDAVPTPPSWWVGEFTQPRETFHVFIGGDPSRQDSDEVTPSSLSALNETLIGYRLPGDASEGQRRLALAQWIVRPDNPLTTRVLANRLWTYHFGAGLVDTPSDFGYMGGRPTHPELLDWLAGQIVVSGWRLKPLHRMIMLSETYQQASGFRGPAAAVDADSRYLWRFPPRRLSAEEVRDSILQVAGVLDTRMGGPGFRLYRYIQDNVATYVPRDEHGPETWRRSVYHQNARAAPIDVLTDFDCPDPAFSAPRRASTITPLQALTLMNHRFATDMAGFFAQRVTGESGLGDFVTSSRVRLDSAAGESKDEFQSGTAPSVSPNEDSDVDRRIRRAFQLAYAREPSDEELGDARWLVEKHGLSALCRALLNSNEFIYVK